MTKVKVGGVDYEVSEAAATAIQNQFNADSAKVSDLESKLTSTKGEREGLQGKLDSADAELKKKEKEMLERKDKSDPAALRKLFKNRLSLEKLAAKSNKDLTEAKMDEMADIELKKVVILASAPEMKLDGKSHEYINGMFEHASKVVSKNEDSDDEEHEDGEEDDQEDLGRAITNSKKSDPVDKMDADEVREAEKAVAIERWKKPLSMSKRAQA